MFNIGFGEIMLVLVVAFVIVGPDDLPKVARWLGRNVRRLRHAIRDIKRETGWDEVEREVNDVRRDVRQTVREMDISADLKRAAADVKKEVSDIGRDVEKDAKDFDRAVKAEIRTMDDDLRAAGQTQTDHTADKPQGGDNHETGNH